MRCRRRAQPCLKGHHGKRANNTGDITILRFKNIGGGEGGGSRIAVSTPKLVFWRFLGLACEARPI